MAPQFLIEQRNEQQKVHCFVNHVLSSQARLSQLPWCC